MTGKENPYYEHFDEILDICQKYDVTISLGDACRPGCLEDATDVSQIEELVEHLQGSSVLCVRTSGYRHCTRI